MNFTAAEMGMQQRPMMIDVSHICHVSGVVCANTPANSTMSVWMIAVNPRTPMKMRFWTSPVQTFHSSMLRVLISLNT